MANQTLAQVRVSLRNTALSCAGIHIYFRLSREDASLLSKEAFRYEGNWEQGISGLQNLPLRVCYVKNKIHGGLIHITTVFIESPWKAVEMGEDEFRNRRGQATLWHEIPHPEKRPASMARNPAARGQRA